MERLRGRVKDYAWGSRSAIPALFDLPPADGPVAELWLGTHAAGAATLEAGLIYSAEVSAEARSLAAVGTFGDMTVNELAFEANLDKAQASRAAQALVERGYLSKRPNPQDARCVILSLTEAGRPMWQTMMQLIEQRNREIFGCLSPAERALLGELFDRLITNAQQGPAGGPPRIGRDSFPELAP